MWQITGYGRDNVSISNNFCTSYIIEIFLNLNKKKRIQVNWQYDEFDRYINAQLSLSNMRRRSDDATTIR